MKKRTANKMKKAWTALLSLTLLIGTISFQQSARAAVDSKALTLDETLAAQKKLSSANEHYAAVTGNGSVSVWGKRQTGEPGTPGKLRNIVAVASSSGKSFALRKDGTIAQWGAGNNLNSVYAGVNPSKTKDAVAISASRGTLFTVHRTGKVSFYHYINDGGHAILNLPKGLSGVKEIAAGPTHVLALKKNGTVVAWGQDKAGNTRVPKGLSNVVAVAAGSTVSAALRSDGTAVAWGMGLTGAAKMNIPYRDVVGIAAGFSQVFLLRSDGSLVSWQEGKAFPVVALPKLKAIASSGEDELIGLTDDGRYIKWTQSFSPSALEAPALTSIAAIAVPTYSRDYVAVREDGSVFISGDLYNVGPGGRDIPPTDAGIAAVSLSNHGLALTKEGTVLAWGSNAYGEATVPSDLRDVVAVEAGYEFSLALKKDGTVVAWGRDRFGNTKIPDGLKDVVAISTGYRGPNLALKSDGTIVAWGSDPEILPANLPKSIAIAASGTHQAAVHEDGTISIWNEDRDPVVNIRPKLGEGHSIVSLNGGSFLVLWAIADDGTAIAYDYDTGKEVKRIEGFRGIVGIDNNLGITKTGDLVRLDPDSPDHSPKFEVLSGSAK